MLFIAGLILAVGAVDVPPRIILDTDFRSDVDDVGALALLNALTDNGECDLIGIVASQTGPSIVSAINAVNCWYGRCDVPIGLSPVDDQRFPDHYAPVIGDPSLYPSKQSNATAPESTALYRRLLHESPDKSVKIIVIGGQTCLRLLLESAPDHEKDGSVNRSGRALVEDKVAGLYLMAGNFVDKEHAEHNIMLDLKAAQFIVEQWPTPIVFSGFEIGRDVVTGGAGVDPERNPVVKAYERFPAGGVGVVAGSSSYDQTMAYCAVRGVTAGDLKLWELSEPGVVSFPKGPTVFDPHSEGKHRYLIARASNEEVAKAIEALMFQPPKSAKAK